MYAELKCCNILIFPPSALYSFSAYNFAAFLFFPLSHDLRDQTFTTVQKKNVDSDEKKSHVSIDQISRRYFVHIKRNQIL